MKLYRIIIPVKNLEIAISFYTKLFQKEGIKVSLGRYYIHSEEIVIALYDSIADGDGPSKWKFHENQYLYFAVDSLSEIHKKIKKLGINEVGEIQQMPWGELLFYAKDPFGTPLCFVDTNSVFKGW